MDSKDLPSPAFDLDIYATNYEGLLLPLRLAHVAANCPSLASSSLDLALTDAHQGRDVELYRRLHDLAVALGVSNEVTALDTEWMARQGELNKRELSRLEGELRGYKNNLIRESIRMGQEDLAMHLLNTGGPVPDSNNPQSFSNAGYSAAYQAFGKMREYCTTPTHIASLTLHLLYTALIQAVSAQQSENSPTTHYSAVLANAGRLRSVGVKDEEQTKLTPIVQAMSGIAQLGLGMYREATLALIATPTDYAQQGAVHGIDFTRAGASGNDIAIYGGLCALATMTRYELSTQVLSGPFRAFLEIEPHMRKAISLYVTAKYQACLATIRRYAADWNLDVFLGAPAGQAGKGSHVDCLFARIREKSITAYFASFSEVSLRSLSMQFPSPEVDPSSPSQTEIMEREILSMIELGVLDARLDPVAGVVVAPSVDIRADTLSAASTAADDVERSLLLRLHKVNMVMAGLEIPRSKGNSAWAPPPGSAHNLEGKVWIP